MNWTPTTSDYPNEKKKQPHSLYTGNAGNRQGIKEIHKHLHHSDHFVPSPDVDGKYPELREKHCHPLISRSPITAPSICCDSFFPSTSIHSIALTQTGQVNYKVSVLGIRKSVKDVSRNLSNSLGMPCHNVSKVLSKV